MANEIAAHLALLEISDAPRLLADAAGGVGLNKPQMVSRSLIKPVRPTIASDVYSRLRSDILSGQLAPGIKLRVEFVSERYSSGASPVREALNRLSSEGFVDRHDQRGFTVTPVSEEKLQELVRTRCMVESAALRESIRRRSALWEEAIVLAYHRLSRTPRMLDENPTMPNPEWEDFHKAFHMALITNCGSDLLTRFCRDLHDQAFRYRNIAVRLDRNARNVAQEHEQLKDLTLSGDAEAAVALLQRHYEKTASLSVGLLESTNASHRS